MHLCMESCHVLCTSTKAYPNYTMSQGEKMSQKNTYQWFPEGKGSQEFSLNSIEEDLLPKSTTRRALLAASALAAVGMAGCATSTTKSTGAATPTKTIVANNIPTTGSLLQKLLDGNLRFQRGQAKWPDQTLTQRQAVAQKQAPFA